MSNKAVKIFLIHEKKEYLLNQEIFANSTYIDDLISQYPNQNPIKITLPKWVTLAVIEIFQYYMANKTVKLWKEGSPVLPENTLQRVLWLADFLQIEDFEEKCILNLVIPQIDVGNCLMFLNESFKKLKACEESNDIWYNLLNHCINFTSKNLINIYLGNPNMAVKVNNKILEEIVERSLKMYRMDPNFQNKKEIVDLLLGVRNSKDVFDLLKQTKKIITSKNINSETHPNINWKLSNISSMINKETNEFKFHGFTWKLKARVEGNDGNSLKIYLKNTSLNPLKKHTEVSENDENLIEVEMENLTNNANLSNYEYSLSKTGVRDIISVYYRMDYGKKTTGKEVVLKNFNISLNDEILISRLSFDEWSAYKSKELSFTIYLNVEHTHSTILIFIAENLKQFLNHADISALKKEDIVSIIKYCPSRNEEQDTLLLFLIKWAIQNQAEEKVWLELFNNLEWNAISFINIVTLYGYRMIRCKEGMSIFLEKIIKDQIEKTPGKYLELADFSENSASLLNHLDTLVNKINASKIPVEIEVTNLKDLVKKLGAETKKNLPVPSRNINNLEINKTVYGEIKTRKSLFPENKRELNENRENIFTEKEDKRETTNISLNDDPMDPNLPSNKLNKLKERQKIFKDYTMKVDMQNEGILFKPPITPLMQEHPIQREMNKKQNIVPVQYTQNNLQKMAASRINLYNYDTKNEFGDSKIFNEGPIDYSQIEEERMRIFERIEKEKEQRRATILNQLNIKNYIGADSKWLLKEFS